MCCRQLLSLQQLLPNVVNSSCATRLAGAVIAAFLYIVLHISLRYDPALRSHPHSRAGTITCRRLRNAHAPGKRLGGTIMTTGTHTMLRQPANRILHSHPRRPPNPEQMKKFRRGAPIATKAIPDLKLRSKLKYTERYVLVGLCAPHALPPPTVQALPRGTGGGGPSQRMAAAWRCWLYRSRGHGGNMALQAGTPCC